MLHLPVFRFLVLWVALCAAVLAPQAEAALNAQEQAIVDRMANASGQGRAFLKVDPILSQVARARAADMARRGYFSHENPDGHGPNYLVRQAGYSLPPFYSAEGNNVESIAAGRASASETWSDWMSSSPHKRHLLGEIAFYAEQTSIGVGYVYEAGSRYRAYWVVITAPPSASVELPFTDRQGTYTGLLMSATDRDAESSGRLQLKLTGSGSFTGNILLGGVRYALRGKLDTTGSATVKLGRSGGMADLQLDSEGAGGLSLRVTMGSVTSTTTATLGLPKTSEPYRNAGRYTVSIPRNPEDHHADIPDGEGYATLRVDRKGQGRLIGSLSDGRSFSVAGSFRPDGTMTIYAPLYGGRGVLAGQMHFNDSALSDLEGQMLWVKPPTSGIHPHAFRTDAPLLAGRYVPPGIGETVFEVAAGENNATLQLGAGDLEALVTQPVTLDATNRVRLSAPALKGLRLKVNAAAGIFSGSFIHPATGASTRIGGVIFQKQNAGFGYFLGKQASGYIHLARADTAD